MSRVQSGSEATAASLVGSLATFSLVDILDLLARTGQAGELHVVGGGYDGRIWMDRGDLVTSGSSVDTDLFELACVEEGWFYFTAGERSPSNGSRMPALAVLAGLGPQVAEWRSLVVLLPFEALVRMSSSTPAAEVQIRADQWQLLSLVGSGGHSVRDVVDGADSSAINALRTLRELLDNRLIVVDGVRSGSRDEDEHEDQDAAPAPPPVDRADESALPPFVPPPVPPAPDGWVVAEGQNGAPVDVMSAIGNGNGSDASLQAEPAQNAVMPPPISGDPWSSALSTEADDED